jgi:superfamily II DNA or RNA helicase
MSSYLGEKGYTLFKQSLSPEKLQQIKKDLTIQPFVMGNIGGGGAADTFPVYRETATKLFVPHYYGVEHFGPPTEYKIHEGADIDLSFCGTLRENQAMVVDCYLASLQGKRAAGGLLELPCAYGKTVLSLSIISQLKKKTLIIVQKEFLMNQWIERISQFLPQARVGKIQGQVVDIEDKEIVIGMLQSLSMKDYPAGTFHSFGLLVADEVHHISSCVFSQVLFKVVTKYTLGLSATMTRKDGTTHVIKMFLGDIIYKGKRDEAREVVVRAIRYHVDDDEFNEVKMDFRGNPMYSTMITKLCEYNDRTEFILRIMGDMLRENPAQQIIVLAHNKNLLKYIHDAVEHRQMATVGYYVGGMKEAALKASEQKTVVVATYAMASEALDIKTLTTLIMATPKTDIEQSVGRILREKHSHPVVVDIIDEHGMFQNQWNKRKAFYKKENYKIVTTMKATYQPDASQWQTIFHPKGSKCPPTAADKEEEKKDKDPFAGKCFLLGKPK